MLFIIAIAGGVAIIGSLLNNNSASNVDQAEVNPNYTQNTQNSIIDNSDTSGYKTPITITTISGEKLILSNYAGKVVVLYFHFLQCSACKYHSPALQAATSALGSDKVIVIAISVSAADTSELLNEWATSNGYNFKLAKDTDYSLSSYFGAQYTPHTVFSVLMVILLLVIQVYNQKLKLLQLLNLFYLEIYSIIKKLLFLFYLFTENHKI